MTRLSEIRRRLEAATPGPWRFYYDDAEPEWIIVHTYLKETREFGGAAESIPATQADAELICHSPQDLRDLLELAEAAKAVKDWLHWPAVVGAFSLQAIHGGVPLEISVKAQDILVRFESAVSRLNAPEVEG